MIFLQMHFHLIRGITTAAENEDPTPTLISSTGPYFSYSTIILPYNSNNTEELYIVDYNSDNFKDLIVSRLVWPGTYPASYAPMQSLKIQGNELC